MTPNRTRCVGTVLQLARMAHTSNIGIRLRCCTTAAAQLGLQPQTDGPGSLLQQRYDGLLQSGVLKPDRHQQLLIQQLSTLLQQLHVYSRDMSAHRVAKQDYNAKYQQRMAELKAADDLKEQEQGPGEAAPASWFQQLLHSTGLSKPSSPPGPSPQQRARQAAAARAAAVVQELGTGPEAPAAPQGLYIYGSVGSGKSLLMDMFHDIAHKHLNLDHTRRMHFNAAMLELHSRLHHLDTKQKHRQQQRRQAAAAAATALPPHVWGPAGSSVISAGSSSPSAASAEIEVVPFVPEQEHAFSFEYSSSSAAAAAGGGADTADTDASAAGDGDDDSLSDAAVSSWFDDAVLRQKEAKAAVLAIRRHLRAARAGGVPEARLAAANAAVMLAAARSFIRAGSSDPQQGWSSRHDRVAALLCFDEMQVSDVWSAAALKALLEALTAEGCVVVTTSNRHPAELPRHGLHEAMFGHFLNTLFSSCQLFEMSARDDYRRLALTAPATMMLKQPVLPSSSSGDHDERCYFWPLSSAAEVAMQHRWVQILGLMPSSSSSSSNSNTGSVAPHPAAAAAAHGSKSCHAQPSAGLSSSTSCSSSASTSAAALMHSSPASGAHPAAVSAASAAAVVPVMFGRQLVVSRCAAGAAWFDFLELCGRPLGAADYLAVAQNYHTVFISGIPAMSMSIRDQARRFITLVDELYNARVLLVCSAALPPDQLFTGAEGEEPIILDLEGLQFEGAVEGSRLRRNLMEDGGVAPVAASASAIKEATALLGGMEERFAFSRAVSRLYEMQSPLYAAARPRK